MDSRKILIVDDHDAVRKAIRKLLSSRSEWTICGEASNGIEAIAKTRDLRPDLVLMDISMPQMDGVEASRIIKRELPEIRIIIVSQNDPNLVSRQAAEAGASGYLAKSELGRKLIPAVGQIAGQRGDESSGIYRPSRTTINTAAKAREPVQTENGDDMANYKDQQIAYLHRERFSLVAQASDIGIWFCNLPFDKLIWDAKVKEHFWLSPDAEVTIADFYGRLHPDDRETTRLAIEAAIANRAPYDVEYRTVAPDGREHWIRALGRAFYDAAGRPTRFDGLTINITSRKSAEEREKKIREEATAATAKFRAIFEQTTQFAGIMTKNGILIDANRLSTQGCGYRAEEVLGKPFWETAWWRNFPESQDKIKAAVPLAANGTPYREVLHFSLADGSDRLVDFALYPILDNHGQVLYLHPTGVDVTELKRAEENARKLAESLEAEVHARTAELENRNCEVMTQADLLRTFSQRLLRTQDEERRHIARELHDSAGQTLTVLGMDLAQLIQKAQTLAPDLIPDAERAQDLVQQLHREIRTTSYLLHPPLLDESGLFSAVSWYVDGLIERSGLEISLIISDELGRLPRDMELIIFRLVQECLTNIHRHSGSKTASIRIGRQADTVKLVIEDEGKGISPERLAEIQSRGSGVGIRGMRERLRQYDGTLHIHSGPTGTTIAVNIPVPNNEDQAKGAESLKSSA